jgi:hypothetical protein
MGPRGEPMKPLLVASSSCWYGECRSVRDSAPLAVIELRAAWRLWGMGMWRPVRYGESWEAWRSYEVMVCQKSFKDEVILSHCQPCARRGRRPRAPYCCAMVSAEQRESETAKSE